MRDELEKALDLYEGMPEAGRRHWRDRAIPSIKFENEDERKLFMENLDRIDRDEDRVD